MSLMRKTYPMKIVTMRELIRKVPGNFIHANTFCRYAKDYPKGLKKVHQALLKVNLKTITASEINAIIDRGVVDKYLSGHALLGCDSCNARDCDWVIEVNANEEGPATLCEECCDRLFKMVEKHKKAKRILCR